MCSQKNMQQDQTTTITNSKMWIKSTFRNSDKIIKTKFGLMLLPIQDTVWVIIFLCFSNIIQQKFVCLECLEWSEAGI